MSFTGIEKLRMLVDWEPMKITEIIEDGPDCYPWREIYAWWPRRTVSGKYVWGEKIYKRKVWVRWGVVFHSEPFVQYATSLDILADKHNVVGETKLLR